MELFQASHQWATRPPDERFVSLIELDAFARARKAHSKDSTIPSRGLTAVPDDKDPSHKGLLVRGPAGNLVVPTHWAYGQLASRTGIPHAAAATRVLPAPVAADVINFGLKAYRDVEDVKVLLYKNGGPAALTAVTGPGYGRVWNSVITGALVDRFGDGISGSFRVPGEFGKRVKVDRGNTTLYASDRDMFVFLADEENKFEIPNGRVGAPAKRALSRGFFVWNSEVGKTSYGIAMFIFDYACCNRIVWGVEEVVEIRGRHTASAPEKFVDEIFPAIDAFAKAPVAPTQAKLIAAQKRKVDDLEKFLAARFTRSQATAIVAAHDLDEGRPMATLWDVATGITAYARNIVHVDARLEFEREAGRVLDLAA